MDEGFFGGSFETLRHHWNNQTRAEKFRKGQTRTRAVDHLVDHIETDIHMGSWLDTGTGAGFVQSRVDGNISPRMFVGLDISREMLKAQEQPFGFRIQGTTFQLPFRRKSFSLCSNVFSLSDYPELLPAFKEFYRVLDHSGIVVYMDYSEGDAYWENRRKQHNTIIEESVIIGDINLRDVNQIKNIIEKHFRVVHAEIISYNVDSDILITKIKLPDQIKRKFFFIVGYKPREN